MTIKHFAIYDENDNLRCVISTHGDPSSVLKDGERLEQRDAPPALEFPEVDIDIDAQSAFDARSLRDTLLAASDWTQVADAPVDQVAWADYRKALRDITSQDGFPENVVWPAQPV